ncbi:MAG TPA: hypothetical protein VMF52_18045 [Steroidobacteraceae bacterium]|nr:hypothetical protein [Steroidobacteraceae bacterium]
MGRLTNYRNLGALTALALLAACGGGKDGPVPPTAPVNRAPAVSAIADLSADQDTVVGPVSFGIADTESDVNALTLAVSADTNAVFAADGIVIDGTGPTRKLTLTPLESATGTTTFTLMVTDPQGATTARSFRVDVKARSASIKQATLSTFAKAETDDATAVNGFTYEQDADDAAVFGPLIPAEKIGGGR